MRSGRPRHRHPGLLRPLRSWSISLPDRYAVPLRLAATPVVGRVEKGRLLLDLRCVRPSDDQVLAAAVIAVGEGVNAPKSRRER